MGLRHVARTTRFKSLQSFAILTCLVSMGASTAFATDGANVRISTFDTEMGKGYFAASIQPAADSTLQQASESQPADVAIIVDTSASQVGQFRTGSLDALKAIVDSLRPGDRVRVYAADVRSTDMSKSFGSASDTKVAMQRLRKRLPLGNTNLATALGTVRSALAAEPQNRTRSIIYIGDGSSIDGLNTPVRFAALATPAHRVPTAAHRNSGSAAPAGADRRDPAAREALRRGNGPRE